MTSEERADLLNAIQAIAEKYGFDVTGYEDDGYLFEVTMERLKIHEVEHSQKLTFEDKFDRHFACWVENNRKAWRFWKKKTRKDYRHQMKKEEREDE